jgi:platelet-activating factor acetylhydrolase IB subunit alpha
MDECSAAAEEGEKSPLRFSLRIDADIVLQIMELESRNANLQAELDSATPTSLSRRNQDPATWLPRSPARHVLQSHRDPVTSVAFHPVFSSLASGSEDYTIKIWD